MVTAEITNKDLIITMTGWDILWCCKKRLEVPLAHITRVRADHHPEFPKGHPVWRIGGSHLPGVITSGNYVSNGKWFFWSVKKGGHSVVIDTHGQKYSQIVIDVPNRDSFVKELRSSITPDAVAV